MGDTAIEIKRLDKKDTVLFEELIRLFNAVFEEKENSSASASYLTTLLSKPNFIALAILYENELAGGLTAYELPLYTAESKELYLYDIAIATKFQRKGFGSIIIDALKEYCKKNDISTFFVEAHSSDAHAVDFYKKAGGDAEEVIHFNFKINP